MTKYFQGITFDKIKIKEGNRETEAVIAMTEAEYNDRSYRDYLKEGIEEKTHDYLRKHQHVESDPSKREALGKALGDLKAYQRRKKSEHPKKYF